MACIRDDDEAGSGDVFMEVSGILNRGQLVLLPAEDKGWNSDLGESVSDVKVITGLEIVEYHGGGHAACHADETLHKATGAAEEKANGHCSRRKASGFAAQHLEIAHAVTASFAPPDSYTITIP